MQISGMLLSSGMFFLMFLGMIFLGQLLYYQQHFRFYEEEIYFNEARILRNIAQNNKLKNNQTLVLNIGNVTYKNSLYYVELNNGKKYQLDELK